MKGVRAIPGISGARPLPAFPFPSRSQLRPAGGVAAGGVMPGAEHIDAAASAALVSRSSSVGNVGGGEDDLFSDSIAGGTLTVDGDAIQVEYGGLYASGTTPTLKAYFGGIAIFDSTAFTSSVVESYWSLRILLIRKSSSTARAVVTPAGMGGGAVVQYTPEGTLTGLDFTAAITLKITGQGASNDDIVATLATIKKVPAP